MTLFSLNADDLPIPFVEINSDGVISNANNEAENLFGRSRRSINGRHCLDLFSNVTVETYKQIHEAVENKGNTVVHNVRSVDEVGAKIAYNLWVSQLPADPSVRLLSVHIVERFDKNSHLDRVNKDASSAIGVAELLAHEIKNPLAGITGAAQLISQNLVDEDLEIAGMIVDECRRIQRLIDQFEVFGNMTPPIRKSENIHDCIDQAARSVAFGAGENARFERNFDPSLPEAITDRDQLIQILINLFRNSVESKPDATICVRTSFEPGMRMLNENGVKENLPLRIDVFDDGPGISDSFAEKLFTPFISGKPNGTGLGLALVAKYVVGLGAAISQIPCGTGAHFRISLPVYDERA